MMAEVKGKFIMLTASLTSLYKDTYDRLDRKIYAGTGNHIKELDPEGWYDIRYYNDSMSAYTDASLAKERALVTLGRNIYPTIKNTTGFPPGLETPLDYIEFELQGYLENIRGPEVKPREIVLKEDRHVVIRTQMTEQPCMILEGVYLGILEMLGVTTGKVKHTKCMNNGDPYCEFDISW